MRAALTYPPNKPLYMQALTMGTGSIDTVPVIGKNVFRGGHSSCVERLEMCPTATGTIMLMARAKRLRVDLESEWPKVS